MGKNNYKIIDSYSTPKIVTRENTALLSTLREAHSMLNELGKEFMVEQNHIDELKSRLASARFHLAILGQFKRGKSTLLNALLGEEILPSAVVPITSIPTFLSWGPNRFIKVIFHNGSIREYASEDVEDLCSFLTQHVAETNNPKNSLGVARVDITHPSSLLKKGVVLIDTPGIGSTFQHNTEATLNFLPQCDMALFLVSSDPPITQVEIEFLKAIRARVVQTIFIMNKIDYLSENERGTAIDFLQAVLQEHLGLDGDEPIFSISARQGLDAKARGNDLLLKDSGISSLEDYLLKFLSEEKMHTLNIAVAKKAGDILNDSLLRLRLKRRSLTMPIEDLEQRLAVFNQKLNEIKQKRVLAKDILDGDRKRTLEILEQKSEEIRKAAQAQLSQIIEEVIKSIREIKAVEPAVHNCLNEAVPQFFEAALLETANLMNERVQESLHTHQEEANALADAVRQTAAELFEIPFTPIKNAEVLEIFEKPCWITENWTISMNPIPRGILERVLPRSMAIRRIRKWLQQDLETIISHNIEKLRWPTLQRINDNYQRFILDLDQQLEEVAKTTRCAIEEAHSQRRHRAESVNEELNRLKNFEIRLEEIKKEFVR